MTSTNYSIKSSLGILSLTKHLFSMIIKFETKSVRVKGISFHPIFPWLLISLCDGKIQWWEYQKKVLLYSFEEHEGPVRCVQFHGKQPIFVSGGDDLKIKVWNYKQKRCIFTLIEHSDYIRTCFFHHTHPWIVSGSDDNTIRVWNWQSRYCVAVLTGHSHYVMCAQFHSRNDLIVSGSLDTTIRIWNITSLVQKNVSTLGTDLYTPKSRSPDLFNSSQVFIKHILEGHERGVNWVMFHSKQPWIVSSSDDRTVRLWCYDDYRAVEMETFRGHFNNVSCAIFHHTYDWIISNSEDKHIRVWDIKTNSCVKQFKKENDRFWILTQYHTGNLFVAGHESGAIVFKLEKERTPCALYNNFVYFVKDRNLRLFDMVETKDTFVIPLKKSVISFNSVASLYYNPAENAILLTSNGEDNTYELYFIPLNSNVSKPRRGFGLSAVWVSRNKFAVLELDKTLTIKDINNEVTKTLPLPHSSSKLLFFAGFGNVIVSSEEHINLIDLQQKQSVAEKNISGVKNIVWSTNFNYLAIQTNFSITICKKNFTQQCLLSETMKIKSLAWDDGEILLYTTVSHIKYLLLNGDTGIIRTLDIPIYIVSIREDKVFCFDREKKSRILQIDTTEYKFKYALINRQYDEVLYMISKCRLVGQSIIAYLQQKGYPEIALHFVTDEKSKFLLALECTCLDIALESAKILDEYSCWSILAKSALKYGNHQIAEFAYQQTKDYDQLLFLYLITGNYEKLEKLKKIATYFRDSSYMLQISLITGDIENCTSLLKDAGQQSLSTLLNQFNIEHSNQNNQFRIPFYPPTPSFILSESNWPLLAKPKEFFDSINRSGLNTGNEITGLLSLDEIGSGWKDSEQHESTSESNDQEYSGWNAEDNIEFPEEIDLPKELSNFNYFIPTSGVSWDKVWKQNCILPSEFIAIGDFSTAFQLLTKTAGIVRFSPLKSQMLSIVFGSQTFLQSFPSISSIPSPISLNNNPNSELDRPFIANTLVLLEEKLQNALQLTTKGDFSKALSFFKSILYMIPLLSVETKQKIVQVSELLKTCQNYVLGLLMETERQNLSKTDNSTVRVCELAAYFTHCDLQPIHHLLTLRGAANKFYQVKNFKTAISFSKRILQLAPPLELAQQAKKIIAGSQKSPIDEVPINYNEHNPFSICCYSFKPIYKGNALLSCPYCFSFYHPEYKDKICTICDIAKIGLVADGLFIAKDQTQ